MEKLIAEEICKNLKWYERIIVKKHKKLIYKIYREGARYGFNFNK